MTDEKLDYEASRWDFLLDAVFWYLVLAVGGPLLIALGIGLQFGIGFAAIALGVLMVVGSEIVRNGMRRA